jgi:hypothetical protein
MESLSVKILVYKLAKPVFVLRPTRVKKIKTHRWSLGGGFS